MEGKVLRASFRLALGAACAATGAVSFSGCVATQEVLPKPEAPFKGHIGRTYK
jgi:hypothetical protein